VSGTTPAQAAYEAWRTTGSGKPSPDWDRLSAYTHERWIAAAQAAYEAMAARSLHDDGPPGASIGWEALEPWQHGRWEAAAQAAVDESDSLLTAQLAMAQEAISDLAAERDDARAVAAEFRAQLESAVREGDEAREQLAIVLQAILANSGDPCDWGPDDPGDGAADEDFAIGYVRWLEARVARLESGTGDAATAEAAK
jgi:phage/plasmid-associated DNA primase